MLKFLKKEADFTFTENGAVTYESTMSDCLDLFATIGALRGAEDEEIIGRFIKAYAEDADLAMKLLFYARDIRGGLGERQTFKTILHWLAEREPGAVQKNIVYVGEYGRYDDLLALVGTPCEAALNTYIREQLAADLAQMEAGGSVSLLAKWMPSVNTSNGETVKAAKQIAKGLGMNDAKYRKTLSALRAYIKILENNLREKDYTFDYEKQPSGALYKYRRAFLRNDEERYKEFILRAEEDPCLMHTGTLTPYDVIAPLMSNPRLQEFAFRGGNVKRLQGKPLISAEERRVMNATWNALENYVGAENSLVVVDGSGSMYWSASPMPAAVAQSLGIYFAERNTGAFHNHFITFSGNPRLVEIKGRDIVEKVQYCVSYNECSNTDLAKTFDLILRTAVKNRLKQSDMPERLYIISDMEFDVCAGNAGMTNFESAKEKFAKYGYKLPQVVFWNVASRNRQQPVKKNEQGVALVSGCSPRIFGMLQEGNLDPYHYMLQVLDSERYERIGA